MTIKGILFDKDGTLIRFESIWIDATYRVIEEVARAFGQGENQAIHTQMAEAIGLYDREVSERGFLASGTSIDFASAFAPLLQAPEDEILLHIDKAYEKETRQKLANVEAIGEVSSLFKQLKQWNYHVGIITADTYNNTIPVLEKLGIERYVDFIGTADRYAKKPGVEALDSFCDQAKLRRNEVIHIGDTEIDLQFATHCLCGVGVLSGVGTQQTLSRYTEYVIRDIHELVGEDQRLICETV
ncbi:HAD family hydrolase [Shouchella shacheensis]|uniref:HAD family hydrolase n=1 Tax=Shouchella shacheensis TaxID=1649580 RepID=UPI00073FBFBB|nr:HAD-IA family hydrolase [Shouchella shacheensis]